MNKPSFRYMKFFVFVTGLIILVLELTASRLLAPYFGTSIFVWANIIGIILLALALGYNFGGRFADRRPEYKLLMRVTLTAGLFVSVIPFMFRLFTPILIAGLNNFNYALIVSSFIVVVILFFIPTFLLGFISPFTVRLVNTSVETTGSSAGSLYAWSTAGSIFGTFLTAFVAVPLLGTQETIYLSAIILILLSVFGLRRFIWYLFLLIPIGLYFLLNLYNLHYENGLARPRSGVIYEKETPYQFIQVIDDESTRRLITDSGFGTQTVYGKKKLFTGTYFDYMALFPPALKTPGENLDILIIGLAGGAISHLYDSIYSDIYNLNMTGVDRDSDLIEAGKKYFALDKQPIDIQIADGRTWLRESDDKYDIIFIDAYENQLNIPFHLITQEFFDLTSEHLTANGMVAFNINASERSSRLLESFLDTIASVYPKVYVLPVENSFNYIVMASQQNIIFDKADYPKEVQLLAQNLLPKIEHYQSKGRKILTDNWAPIELMTDSMYLQYIWNAKS